MLKYWSCPNNLPKNIIGKNLIRRGRKFRINKVNYYVTTNKNGITKKILGKKVINTLKKGKTYKVKVNFAKATIKTNVKVK